MGSSIPMLVTANDGFRLIIREAAEAARVQVDFHVHAPVLRLKLAVLRTNTFLLTRSYRPAVRGSPRTTCARLLPFSKLAADFALAASLI